MPVWLLVTIICVGLLLIGSLVDWRAKRQKQTLLIDNNNRNSLDEGYDPRGAMIFSNDSTLFGDVSFPKTGDLD